MKALRVLVVEDDALIAMLLSELLAGMGHDVCATAASEAEAVTAATRYRPDLMIVDAGLGRGSGVSAVEEILRAGPIADLYLTGDPTSSALLKSRFDQPGSAVMAMARMASPSRAAATRMNATASSV